MAANTKHFFYLFERWGRPLVAVLIMLLEWPTMARAAAACKTWLTAPNLSTELAALEQDPTPLLPLTKNPQTDLQLLFIDFPSVFFHHEYFQWAELGAFRVVGEGQCQNGQPWQVTYFDQAAALHSTLWLISPEWLERPPMLQNLQKAWQSFPAIYLSKIKVWGFPFAAYKNNVTRYLKTKHDARFKEQGVIVEWNRIDRSMANGTIAYIHPAGQQKATLTFFQQAMAQALSSVWFDELKNQPHFIAAWKQAAKQDHASEVFSPNAILPLLLPSTAARPQHQHRQKVLAAAARLAAQHDLPLKVRSNTAPSAIFNDLPKVNLAQVLRARVLVTPDPLAQAEKDFIKENPALEILPEQSLFWGRKNGVGKLYQVVRLEGRTQIAFKFLIEDFSQNPALEQAAMQQIKWIAAMVPGKLWQQLSTVHILPAQGKIQNLNWTTMSMRTTPLTLNGLAKLKLTFSLEDPAKKDLIIFLEEGLAPQLNSPGLAQLIARDLASWFNRNNP